MARPRKIEQPEHLQEAFSEYITACDAATKDVLNNKGGLTSVPYPIIPTLGDFCYKMGITTEGLAAMENHSEAFFRTIKGIKEVILRKKEYHLMQGNGNTTGLIFDLKCNYGWKDKQTIEHEGEIIVTMNLSN